MEDGFDHLEEKMNTYSNMSTDEICDCLHCLITKFQYCTKMKQRKEIWNDIVIAGFEMENRLL
jgi:hypothetical protein